MKPTPTLIVELVITAIMNCGSMMTRDELKKYLQTETPIAIMQRYRYWYPNLYLIEFGSDS